MYQRMYIFCLCKWIEVIKICDVNTENEKKPKRVRIIALKCYIFGWDLKYFSSGDLELYKTQKTINGEQDINWNWIKDKDILKFFREKGIYMDPPIDVFIREHSFAKSEKVTVK